jgi:hypothetical protein
VSKTVQVPFGPAYVTAELPDDTFFIPYAGGEPAHPIENLASAVSEALSSPLDSPPLEELASPQSRVLIAFDDPTVPAYGPIRHVIFHEVLRRLLHVGVKPERITAVCANALHRKFREWELASIVGQDIVDFFGERMVCHDAENPDEIVEVGTTASGYYVDVSRHVVESDLTIYINAAHFRGFAGGWKSICVGLSTYRSIRHHHTPDGMSMSVDDNPMHRMLEEMGRHLEAHIPGRIFKIDTVEANPFQSAYVFAGSPWATRKAALEKLRLHYPPRRALSSERYDVILYGVPDWSPYAIFAEMNPILTLISSGLGYLGGTIQALGKPGCTVIMATPCPLRWDFVHHPSYPDVWANVLSRTCDPYRIDAEYTDYYAHHADYIKKYRFEYAFHPVHAVFGTQPLRRLKHCGRVIVAGIESPAVAEHLHFLAARDIPEALEMAKEFHGTGYSLAYAQHPAAPTKVTM